MDSKLGVTSNANAQSVKQGTRKEDPNQSCWQWKSSLDIWCLWILGERDNRPHLEVPSLILPIPSNPDLGICYSKVTVHLVLLSKLIKTFINEYVLGCHKNCQSTGPEQTKSHALCYEVQEGPSNAYIENRWHHVNASHQRQIISPLQVSVSSIMKWKIICLSFFWILKCYIILFLPKDQCNSILNKSCQTSLLNTPFSILLPWWGIQNDSLCFLKNLLFLFKFSRHPKKGPTYLPTYTDLFPTTINIIVLFHSGWSSHRLLFTQHKFPPFARLVLLPPATDTARNTKFFLPGLNPRLSMRSRFIFQESFLDFYSSFS